MPPKLDKPFRFRCIHYPDGTIISVEVDENGKIIEEEPEPPPVPGDDALGGNP